MKKWITLLSLTLSITFASAGEINPVAHPAAVVTEGNARFTVLTDRLIRMEWAEDGVFEDRASLAIINRNLSVPQFKVTRNGGTLVLTTAKVKLTYKGGRFDASNLSVSFNLGKKPVTWHPGLEDKGNLKGTTRTLDGCLGFEKLSHREKELENGILSRDGWAIVDESKRHLFEKVDADWGDWVTERPEGDRLDWYIFAYGHDYTAALKDFTQVAGKIPLPPKYTFGYWWSRYWIYTDDEMLDLGREMRERGIPMDVMIIDMDWHYTYKDLDKRAGHDDFNQRRGWTGYTWNRDLFPDPEGFLKEVHEMGYKTALNLHPASGIRPYEECYDAFLKDYLSRTDDYDGPKDYIFGDEPYLYQGNKKPVGKPGNGYGERPFSGNGYAVEDRLSRRRAEYRRRVYGRFPGKWDRVCDLHGLPPSNGVYAPPWTRQGWRDAVEFYHGPGKMTREMCGNRLRLQTRRAISRDEARRYRVDYRPVDAQGAGAP